MCAQSHCPVSGSLAQALASLCGTDKNHGDATTISLLPDNVLLETFDLCRNYINPERFLVWNWHLLAHVCRRWRQLIFASPHRLNLRILCTQGTPVRKNLAIWPAFPIVIDYRTFWQRSWSESKEENIIAALEHPNRVCYLRLGIPGSQLGKVATLMQETFPLLTYLDILLTGGNAPVLPDGFLGGSAPRLRSIFLFGIPYPALPMLLLSASDLVVLYLCDIPLTGYISPDAIVACLAALPKLNTFTIEFQSTTSHPGRIRPPPVTRTVLPALTNFRFRGGSGYLEDLVAQIDGPQLESIFVEPLDKFVDFQAVQTSQFINRSIGPELTPLRYAKVNFSGHRVFFHMNGQHYPYWDGNTCSATIVSHGVIFRQVSHVAQVLRQYSTILSTVTQLELELDKDGQLGGTNDDEWVHMLNQFPFVQILCVFQELAGQIALALENITGVMTTEVLPSLHLICLQDQPASSVERFITARRLSDRPVIVVDTYIEYAERLTSYVGK